MHGGFQLTLVIKNMPGTIQQTQTQDCLRILRLQPHTLNSKETLDQLDSQPKHNNEKQSNSSNGEHEMLPFARPRDLNRNTVTSADIK